MRRLSRSNVDRGAVSVWVAILMVPLLVVAALAIDVGSAYADRQRLQTGADAAALAIAQHCATGGTCDYGTALDIAQELASENDPFGSAVTIGDLEFDPDNAWVEVQTETLSEYWFAPAIGVDDSSVAARGAASWSGSLPASLPLAFSFCAIQALTGAAVTTGESGRVALDIVEPTEEVILSAKGNADYEADVAACQSNRGWSAAPGNFGWLDVAGSDCFGLLFEIETGVVSGSPGASPVQECKKEAAAFAAFISNSTPLLIPVYSHVEGTGNNTRFHIAGYAVIELEGIAFPSLGEISNTCGKTCVDVRIVDWIDADDAFQPIADPVVALRLPGVRP